MRLKTHELGAGDRTAVLVHGIMASSETWCRVAPALVERGYRVVMPDLRSHGDSPRGDAYSAELFAADLVDTLPRGADLALGHSLGPDFAAELRRRGFEVRTVAGTGHCVHRDDLSGFLSSLEGWI
jgi:pimeloyl-ACP methyl ester carboxylesterase